MSKIKQVLMLHAQGVPNRKIGRELGLYKGTVNSYVQKIRDHGYGIDELLKLDEPVLERKLFAGNPAYKQDRFEEFKVLIPGIEKELSRPHVTRYLLWQEYRESHPDLRLLPVLFPLGPGYQCSQTGQHNPLQPG